MKLKKRYLIVSIILFAIITIIAFNTILKIKENSYFQSLRTIYYNYFNLNQEIVKTNLKNNYSIEKDLVTLKDFKKYNFYILVKDSVRYSSQNTTAIDKNIVKNIYNHYISKPVLQSDHIRKINEREWFFVYKKFSSNENLYFFCLFHNLESYNDNFTNFKTYLIAILSLIFVLCIAIIILGSLAINRRNVKSMELEKEKTILDHISNNPLGSPYFILDRKGIITYASSSALKMLHFKKPQIINKSFISFIKNPQLTQINELDNKQVILEDKAKNPINVLVNVEKIISDSLNYLLILKDITEQKHNREELNKELSKLQAMTKFSELLTNINDPKILTKSVLIETQKLVNFTHGTLLLLDNDKKYLKCYYTTSPDLKANQDKIKLNIGEGLSGVVAETKQGMYLNNPLSSSIASEVPGTDEVDEKLLSIPLISKSKLLGVLTFSRINGEDFTDEDLHLLEIISSQIATVLDNATLLQQLSNSEKTYRSLINEANVGIFIIQEDYINFVNKSFVKIMKTSKANLIDTNFLDLIAESDKKDFKIKLNKFIKTKNIDLQQIKLVRQDNSFVTVELSLSYVHWGKKPAIMGMATDITEKLSLYNQLLQTQKLESVGSLAGGIAHDFKNILAGILGASEMLLLHSKKSSKAYNYASMINKSAERGSALAKRILKFSRKDKDEIKLFDINEVVEEVIEIASHTFSKVIEIEKDLVDRPLAFSGDSVRIQQCILNIAVNARDAMEKEKTGKLTIETEIIEESDLPNKFEAKTNSKYGLVKISDTGIGMDEKTQKKIFEPFFTTKGKEKGTGLGLSTTIKIIEELEGFIDVESELNVGTTFYLYFPLSEEELEQEEKTLSQQVNLEPRNILLVDDENIVLEIAKELLEEIGNTVISANSGKKALEILSENNDIELAIIDRLMPGMDGIELFHEMKKKFPEIKIIISSGLTEDSTIVKLKKEGLSGYITKPYRLEDLIKLLKKV